MPTDASKPPAASPFSNFTNHFLIAMPSMVDPNFGGALVFVAEHSEKGALGLVVNRPMEINLTTLFERIDLQLLGDSPARSPVFYGGPVQTDRGFVLHQPVGQWNSTVLVSDELGLTSSKDILEAVADGRGPERLMVLLGYSGWGPGQLEDEISRNAWLTVPADPALIFDTPVDERVHGAFALLGVNPVFLAPAAGHA
jgi:putative transcriptional regulator